jgi:N-hydroxyarylamine O-acetyltransferase
MAERVDLAAYFERIGYAGAAQSTLQVLSVLHALHPRAIPFENLDPLRGELVWLDLDRIQQKLVTGGRGGYCFEHNTLFAAMLTELGFDVTPMLARVLWMRDGADVTAKSHMLLHITLPEGPFIADVGFGAITLTAPLRLDTGAVQPTPFEPARLIGQPALQQGYDLEVALGLRWQKVYWFEPRPTYRIDHEMANWYTCAHPDSHFVRELNVCRIVGDVRAVLRNDRLTLRLRDGSDQRRRLASAAELAECLAGTFGINIDGMDIDALFEKVREP